MFKRIWFAAAPSSVDELLWVLRSGLTAPPEVRPTRISVAVALVEIDADQRHPALGIEWFEDRGHLMRYESWAAAAALPRPDSNALVLADERILRGADWLEDRWRRGGGALKQMAIAHRAAGLTQQEFSQQWQSRAGSVGSIPIPDRAKGCAYVQNHPVHGQHRAYDAVNEVYFDDLDGLRTRMAWFAETMSERPEDDLISANWFLALREDIVTDDSI